MFIFQLWFWVPVILVLIPSSVVYFALLFAVHEQVQIGNYKSLFYRLFVVQSVIELPLFYCHILGKILINDRLAGNDHIMALNGPFFPSLYYHGTIFYFFHVQVWGVIMHSLLRLVYICVPFPIVRKRIDAIPNYALFLTNTLVPLAFIFKQILNDNISFVLNKDGNAVIEIPVNTIHTNASQATYFTVIATILSAACYAIILAKLLIVKRNQNGLHRRCEKMLTLIGFVQFLSHCSMTAFYVIITVFVHVNMEIVYMARSGYIIPVMLLTFVNPWMLFLTSKRLRKRVLESTTP